MRPAFFRTRGMEAATGCMHPFLPALRPRPARHAGLRNAWAALAPWRPCFSPGAYPPTQPPPVCTHKNTCCRYNPAPQPLLELVAAIVPRALSSRTAFNQQAISSILFSVATLKARPGEPQGPRQVAPVARGCARWHPSLEAAPAPYINVAVPGPSPEPPVHTRMRHTHAQTKHADAHDPCLADTPTAPTTPPPSR